jgi:hypothetical protein
MFKLLLSALLLTSCATKLPLKEDLKPIEIVGKENIFNHRSSLSWVKELSKVANCTVNLKSFQDELSTIERFDYSDDNGKQVLSKLLSDAKTITTYKTKNPWSSAMATTYSADKDNMYLNTRKNPREYKFMVNTVCHEKLHLNGYSHGNNSSVGKENTVNYFVGSLCEKHSKGCL